MLGRGEGEVDGEGEVRGVSRLGFSVGWGRRSSQRRGEDREVRGISDLGFDGFDFGGE